MNRYFTFVIIYKTELRICLLLKIALLKKTQYFHIFYYNKYTNKYNKLFII